MKKLFVSALAVALAAISSPAQNSMDVSCLPLFFEAGNGQSGIPAQFSAHGLSSEFLINPTMAQFVLRKSSGETAASCMQFVGANPSAQVSGTAELAGKVNYLIGNDSSKWQTSIPTFAKVRVENIYPGINVVYYGNGRQLEYDFDLAAGVDPRTISIRFDGADKVSVNPQGELVVDLNGGQIVQHTPVIYQLAGQSRHDISGGYKVLDSHTVTFALGGYDRGLPLVIDPVLSYSTYFGGNNGAIIRAIALGNQSSNEVYIAGETLSSSFTNAPANGFQSKYQGFGGGNIGDAFIAKFGNVGADTLGTNFIYFTYLGGSADDAAYGLAVDDVGHAYVTGATTSKNFPTANAIYSHFTTNSDASTSDAFVAELETNGASLIYSTYLVGDASDVGTAIAVGTDYSAYVAGYTYSTNFPTTPGAYQTSLQCTNNLFYNANGFLTEIAPNGAGLAYSSYFGGNNFDKATAITLDQSGNIYVAGYTASTNFPVVNSWTNKIYLNGKSTNSSHFDAFVTRFAPGFNSLVYSTYLGGSNYDAASGITVDTSGNAYVVGSTTSANFTNHAGPFNFVNQPASNGGLTSYVLTNVANVVIATNVFLDQIGWNGSSAYIGFSLVFGGPAADVANGVAIDGSGNLYVVGRSSSTNVPVAQRQTSLTGSLRATNSASTQFQSSDAFVTAISTSPQVHVLYSAFLGGNAEDRGNAIAVDSAGDAYIAGQTRSPNFPVFNGSQTNFTGSSTVYDGFIAKIFQSPPPPTISATRSSTNLFVSWRPIGQENPAIFQLESNSNLLSPNGWTVVTGATNMPAFTNGTYIYTLPHTNPAQFFRLQLY